MLRFLMLAVGLICPLVGQAMGWSSAAGLWGDTRLLKTGRTEVQVDFQTQETSRHLNIEGRTESLGATSRQVTGVEDAKFQRDFQATVRFDRWTTGWAYGLHPNWTLMARVPFTRIKSDVSHSVKQISGARAGEKVMVQAKTNLDEASGAKVGSPGRYESVRVGRFEIRSKHGWPGRRLQTSKFTFYENVYFPTLETTQLDFVIFPDPLPRGFAAGGGARWEPEILSRTNLVLSSDIKYEFDDKVYGRTIEGLPTSDLVRRTPGMETQAEFGLLWAATAMFNAKGGLKWQRKAADDYRAAEVVGSGASERDSVVLSMSYSKTPGILSHEYGWSAALAYDGIIDGSNVPESDIYSLNFSLIF